MPLRFIDEVTTQSESAPHAPWCSAVLREDVLPSLDMSQLRFAELLGVSRLTVSQLLHEHRALSPDMAMRLEKMLGTTAESWLRMQQAVELWEARQRPERFASIKRLPASAAA